MHAQQESQTALCRGLFLGTETTKTKREQPKPRREWQYNAEKHKGKASASRVLFLDSKAMATLVNYAIDCKSFIEVTPNKNSK